jgi:hypothetical protein
MQINKKDLRYYGSILVLLVLIILTEIFKDKPLDWTFYVERNSKDPYGTYVLYKALPDLFDDVDLSEQTVYQTTKNEYYRNNNFIFITHTFNPQETDTETLLQLARAGNNIFISAFQFEGQFADTLNLKTYFMWKDKEDSLNYSFGNHALRDSVYMFGDKFEGYYFESIDTTSAEVLALLDNNYATFVRQPYGEGFIYLLTQPDVFTNYAFITKQKAGYAYSVLSHMPNQKTVWDGYYKPYKSTQYSPLRYIFRNEALLYAWYVLLVSLLLYMIFTAKRTQRIIPVIEPLKNTSAEFAETLGSLYYHKKNHKQIALNRLHYFKDELSREYFIAPEDFNIENTAYLSEKTGTDEWYWKKFFKASGLIKDSKNISSESLSEFNQMIENFYGIRK